MTFSAAATTGIESGVSPSGQYFVGIGDPTINAEYQLFDGTPVPSADIEPLFVAGSPNDSPSNSQKFITVRSVSGTTGFDDSTCSASFGAICQLQLTV